MTNERRSAPTGRILAAALAASGTGALAAWLGYLLLIMLSVGPSQAMDSAPSLLGFFLIIGWPITLVATVIAGLLLHRLLSRRGLLSQWPVVLAAAAVGAVVLPLAWMELESLLGDPSGGSAIVIGAFSGFAAGWVFWSVVAHGARQPPAGQGPML